MSKSENPVSEQSEVVGELEKGLGVEFDESQTSPDSNVTQASSVSEENSDEDDLPIGIKKKLGRQEKRHQKEMRALQEKLQGFENLFTNLQQSSTPESQNSNPVLGTEEDRIKHAVRLALEHDRKAQKEEVDRQKNAEKVHYLKQNYAKLQDKLDAASSKYDDFDDVVRHGDAPFTETMRDVAMLIDNPDDVLYRLGKNREELKRISQLHPVDQTREMLKLSFALMGGEAKPQQQTPKTLGQIKSNPHISPSITEKTSPSEIRRRMKNGWK